MVNIKGLLSGLFLALAVAPAYAQQLITTPALDNTGIIKQRLQESRPGIELGEINATPIAGLYSVQVLGGPVLYVAEDGNHFVAGGDLYQVVPGGFVNLAEKERESDRKALMASVERKDQIIFSPEQPAQAAITIFTDVDCYYCQKLHREVPDLLRAGIEVRYMAYPRAGVGSDSYKRIASAWCAEDQQDALTKLKNRQRIPTNVCEGNPVADQYALGGKVGVTGTPAMITDQGRLLPGYMPALNLARALGVSLPPELAAELAEKAELAMRQR